MPDLLPNLHETIIGLYASLCVASLALAAVFFRAWRAVARDWLLVVALFFTAPRAAWRKFGRCQVAAEDAPVRMAGALCIIAMGMGGTAARTIAILILSPWSIGTQPIPAAITVALMVWTIAGYYVALVAWQAVEGKAPNRVFMLAWGAVIVIVAVFGAFAAHQVRLFFG